MQPYTAVFLLESFCVIKLLHDKHIHLNTVDDTVVESLLKIHNEIYIAVHMYAVCE